MIAQTFSPICRPIIKIDGPAKEQAALRPAGDERVEAHTARPSAPLGPLELDAEVSLESDSNFYRGFSENGLFLATWRPLPSGTALRVRVSLPTAAEKLQVDGVVKLVRDFNPRTPDLVPGMAIEFRSLPTKVKKVIDAFSRQREPLFYD